MKVTMPVFLTVPEEMNLKNIWEKFTKKWKHTKKDVIEDVSAILKDKEMVKPTPIILDETIEEYKDSKVEMMGKAYDRNAAWAGFLKQFSSHPYYRQILQEANPLETTVDMLGSILDKIQRGTDPGGNEPRTPDEEQERFGKLINQAKNLLELLEDESMQEYMNQQTGGKDTGEDFDYKKAIQNLEKNLHAVQVLDLCNAFDFVMRMSRSDKEYPSVFPEDGLSVRNIRSQNEMLQVLPSQYAMPQDLFYAKLATKELLVKEYTTKNASKSVLYVLLDISSSMQEPIESGDPVEKSTLAASVTISYLRKMMKNKDIFAMRFFEGCTSDLWYAKNFKEAGKMIKRIMDERFNGASTDIQGALRKALLDLNGKTIEKEFLHADILLITDGGAGVNVEELRAIKGKVNIHSIQIGDSKNRNLVELSKNYLMVHRKSDMFEVAKMMNR